MPFTSPHTSYQGRHSLDTIKEHRALRTETTINDPLDFQRTKGLETLPNLRAIGQRINTRLLDVEQLADGARPSPSLFDRLQAPTVSPSGPRVSALRFGDQRVQALFGALCRFSHLPDGFRHRDLRPLVAGLLGRDLTSYSAGAMTYDLRRLRRHGVIERVAGTQRYTLTSDGLRAAFFYTTLYRRLCQLPGADVLGLPHQPSPLTAAIHQLDTAVQQLWTSLSHAA